MRIKRLTVVVFAGLIMQIQAASSQTSDDPTPTVEWGGAVFEERCVLCHGAYGEGEGLLAASMDGYPDTNLLRPGVAKDSDSLRKAIVWGGTQGRMSSMAPPWGDELTWSEIESVLMFMQMLYEDEMAARAILDGHDDQSELPTFEMGRSVFEARCSLCHGDYGQGDGKLSRVITDPPPYNLTLSAIPKAYTLQIILEGGEALGRSKQMPPWKDELSAGEVSATLDFVLSLRKINRANTSN